MDDTSVYRPNPPKCHGPPVQESKIVVEFLLALVHSCVVVVSIPLR